jgi:small-conductance mechanosensitive channel
MEDFLSKTYFDNTVKDYLIALGGILVGMLLLRIFRKTILAGLHRIASRTKTEIDDYIVNAVERFGMPILNFVIINFGFNYLELSEKAATYLHGAVVVVIIYYALRLISSTILMLLQAYVRRQDGGEEKVKQLGGIILLINILIWSVGGIFLFDNLGYDVTAIIAGLGIGGIAIALAAQNILGDLFNYFVIFFDRPFEINDFIIVGDKKGTIEHIGIKTTRLTSLSGEQLVFSNSDLTNSRIHNYKKMQRRRISFTLGVVYETSLDLLKEIPAIVKKIIDDQNEATLDRVHFLTYGDFSLQFEIIYFVESADYNRYADIQQEINLHVFEAFKQKGIEFAYPSQTIFLARDTPST